jgi:flagellar protein FliO/FliZ
MLGDTELLLQSIGSLLLVLAILLVMVFGAKWFMQRRPQGGRRLRFVEAMALSSRDKLLIIEVDGKSLLLGVTTQNIRLLTELNTHAAQPSSLDQQVDSSAESDQLGLSKQFSQLLGRYTKTTKHKDTQ